MKFSMFDAQSYQHALDLVSIWHPYPVIVYPYNLNPVELNAERVRFKEFLEISSKSTYGEFKSDIIGRRMNVLGVVVCAELRQSGITVADSYWNTLIPVCPMALVKYDAVFAFAQFFNAVGEVYRQCLATKEHDPRALMRSLMLVKMEELSNRLSSVMSFAFNPDPDSFRARFAAHVKETGSTYYFSLAFRSDPQFSCGHTTRKLLQVLHAQQLTEYADAYGNFECVARGDCDVLQDV